MPPRRLAAALTAAAALVACLAGPAQADPRPAAPAAAQADPRPFTPVARVEVARYLGTWYQIADIPQFYEVFCLRDVTARYGLNSNGTVAVHNTCTGPGGAPIVTDGTARVLDPGRNASLQVSFVPGPIYLGTAPNYVIMGLAPDYSWAVVGDPDRASGYVLSRTRTLTAAGVRAARDVLAANGYPRCRLTVSRQTGGATTPKPFC